MTLTLTPLVSLADLQSRNGRRTIDQSFTGNRLAVNLRITSNLDRVNKVLGVVTQHYQGARADYQIRASQSVLSLHLPQTDFLSFFPISSLYDEYGLDLAYTNVGESMSETVVYALPENIAQLPNRVTSLESAQAENIVYFGNIETILTALENQSVSVAWNDISGKPTSFTPSAHTHAIADISGLSLELGAINTDAANLTDRVEALETSTPVISGSIVAILLTANAVLESNKLYFATVTDLVCVLPSSPSIGDFVDIATGNYSLRINHGNASQQVLNNNTLTSIGVDNGIILKPYSSIRLVLVSTSLWVSHVKIRTVNNWEVQTSQKASFTISALNNPFPAFGTTVANMINGAKVPSGGLQDGLLAGNNEVNFLLTFPSPIKVKQLKIWSGQGNVGLGQASQYTLDSCTVYRGANTSSPVIGNFVFANECGVEQSKDINDTVTTSQIVIQALQASSTLGILEIEIWQEGTGGSEITVPN